MWKVEYTKRFLKELSKLPNEIQVQAENIVFEELLSSNPFDFGYLERMTGNPDKYKIHYAPHSSEKNASMWDYRSSTMLCATDSKSKK